MWWIKLCIQAAISGFFVGAGAIFAVWFFSVLF